MLTFISAILVFGLLIGIHEAGHLIAAKLSGITVFEFSIGMGPKILSFNTGGTAYSLRLLPIGGFCKMDGEDEHSDNPGAFCNKSVSKRIFVVVAGALMNILMGFMIYIIISSAYTSDFRVNTVDKVIPDSPAYEAGLKAGDEVIRVNGKRVHIPSDVRFELFRATSENIAVTVERNGKKLDFSITPKMYIYPHGEVTQGYFADEKTDPELIQKYGAPLIGYELKAVPKTFGNVLKDAFYNSRLMVKTVVYSVKMLVTGNVGLNDVSGPVGMVDQIGATAKSGLSNLLALTALITINLGVFNLLPFPALDGGRLIFLIIELFRKKPVPPEKEGVVHFVGLAVLLIFMLVVTANDIFKLIGG